MIPTLEMSAFGLLLFVFHGDPEVFCSRYFYCRIHYLLDPTVPSPLSIPSLSHSYLNFLQMLSSKDINFVGYTYKNFEIVNDYQVSGMGISLSLSLSHEVQRDCDMVKQLEC